MALTVMVAHACSSENGTVIGNAGDQTGREVRKDLIENSGKWDYILRPVRQEIATAMAILVQQFADNDNIGYSQYDRYSAMELVEKMENPDPSKITKKCNCDCSSMVRTCAWIATRANINRYMRTSTQINDMTSTGEFKKIEYSKEACKVGDVLWRQGHTATVYSVFGGDLSPNKTPKWVGEVCNCFTLNVRVGAGVKYSIYSGYPCLHKGNLVDVCDEENGWYYIRIAGVHYAYVNAKYIKADGSEEEKPVEVKKELAVGETVTFNGDYLYVSSYKNGKKVSATAHKGKTAKITQYSDKAHPWHIAGNGFSGWANAADLKI